LSGDCRWAPVSTNFVNDRAEKMGFGKVAGEAPLRKRLEDWAAGLESNPSSRPLRGDVARLVEAQIREHCCRTVSSMLVGGRLQQIRDRGEWWEGVELTGSPWPTTLPGRLARS